MPLNLSLGGNSGDTCCIGCSPKLEKSKIESEAPCDVNELAGLGVELLMNCFRLSLFLR